MTTQSSTIPPYTPSPEMLATAERMLAEASAEELASAADLYKAHGAVTGHRSAVTGAELPDFDICRPLVKAGWLAVVRAHQGLHLGAATIRIDTSDVDRLNARLADFKAEVEAVVNGPDGRVDPFLMGISEIASATRNLAEASKAVAVDGDIVADLIENTAKALNARVQALAPPPAEPDTTA